jgi:hypothetical protein
VRNTAAGVTGWAVCSRPVQANLFVWQVFSKEKWSYALNSYMLLTHSMQSHLACFGWHGMDAMVCFVRCPATLTCHVIMALMLWLDW